MFGEGFERVAVDVPNSCLCQTGRIDSDSPENPASGIMRKGALEGHLFGFGFAQVKE